MGNLHKKVALHGVRFFSYHGFYPEERILGNEFILDIEAEMEVYSVDTDDLSHTVNYERLFEIAVAEMKITRKLLETVAHNILEQIRHEFLAVKTIRVCISKVNPPLAGQVESSLVELTFNR